MTAVIETLTPEQDAQLDPQAAAWTAIGLATEDYSTTDAALADIVNRAYAAADLAPPKYGVVRVASPLALRQAVTWLSNQPTWPGAEALQAHLTSVAGRTDLPLLTPTFGFGQHDASWLAFYHTMREVLGLREETEPLVPQMELAKCAGWWVFHEHLALVAERPLVVLLDAEGNLHAEGRQAIAWRDGFGSYVLHGLRFDGPGESRFVTTPADQLDPREVLAITNVDQRAAVIARIGMVRMLEHLEHVVLHTLKLEWSEYKLVELTVGRGARRYLLMENPSVRGLFHLEGVPPTTPTCEAALFYREEGRLPERGESWLRPEVQT